MPKHHPTRHHRDHPLNHLWPTVGIITAVVVVIAFATYSLWTKRSVAPTTTGTDPSAVTITTADGVKLAATIKYPVRSAPGPAVVLLHQYGLDRHQWDPYLQRFLDAGFAVLSYDLRGFGDSRLATIPASQAEHLDSLPNDLSAMVAFLRRQPSIDPAAITLVGASVGADVAYVGIGAHLGFSQAVLLSPVVRGTALDGHLISDFNPSRVYGLASDQEQADLQTFMAKVQEPKQTKIINGSGHGIELLSGDGVLDGIIQWINQ